MAWLKNKFKKIFGKNNPTPSAPTKPESPTPEYTPKPGIKIALVRGHGGNDSGATGNGTNEVEYNTWAMDYVAKYSKRNLKLFKASSSMDAIVASRSFSPDITIQLHLNSFNGQAHGCEVLVLNGDTKSYPIAEKFSKELTQRFNRKMRGDKGKKILDGSGRGAGSLYATKSGVKILVEPFFIDNKTDFIPKELYAKFLLDFTEKL